MWSTRSLSDPVTDGRQAAKVDLSKPRQIKTCGLVELQDETLVTLRRTTRRLSAKRRYKPMRSDTIFSTKKETEYLLMSVIT